VSTTANKNAIGMVSEMNGTMMYRNGRNTFSRDKPKATRTSDKRTNWETTIIEQITTSAEKNCGISSLSRYLTIRMTGLRNSTGLLTSFN
jgi:hypothetical protein